MPTDFIGVDVSGIKELKAILEKIPEPVANEVINDLNVYVTDVLRLYPAQKRVTRKSAYGQTFFSDKQRRYFFAALRKGEINVPYHRTQKFRDGWKIIGEGRNSIIANEVEYGGLVMGDGTQSRMADKIGWQTVSEVIDTRRGRLVIKTIQSIASKSVKRVIKKLFG